MLQYLHYRASPLFNRDTATYLDCVNSCISIYLCHKLFSPFVNSIIAYLHCINSYILVYLSSRASPLLPGTSLHTHIASIAACLYFCCRLLPFAKGIAAYLHFINHRASPSFANGIANLCIVFLYILFASMAAYSIYYKLCICSVELILWITSCK